tara:strand:- start:170 stop:361 length:192 start_codon:yes stop_codon:yes gene_type:complete
MKRKQRLDNRIKYLERGLIPDLGQLDGTVPPDMNHHVFTLRVQGKSYREIALAEMGYPASYAD